MKDMLFTFTTNMTCEETAIAIKKAILRMSGTVRGANDNFVGRFRIPRGWEPKYHTLFKTKCHFYVGKNGVRAILRTSNLLGYCVGEHEPIGEERVWDAFIRMFLALYPDCDIDIMPGTIRFQSVTVQDGSDIYRYSSVAKNSPSVIGAIVGGTVAGEVGAVIGSSYGKSRVSGSMRAERNPNVRVIGRYTNGHNQDSELPRVSARYHEIMVKFDTSGEAQ